MRLPIPSGPIFALLLLISTPGQAEPLGYHTILTNAQGLLLPWRDPDPAKAYDFVVRQTWRFWNNLESCSNGIPYYFQHQVWKPEHDARGLGGDQLAMALSSWALLYAYTGDPAVRSNAIRIADYALDRGLSPSNAAWANLPYPYNTELHSGRYDGDMRAGKDVLQPDKAASFGAELIELYQSTSRVRYLAAALAIADTLAAKIQPGDADHSPWPFRVNALTGEVPGNPGEPASAGAPGKLAAQYTANWTGALRLFDTLIALKLGATADYTRARTTLTAWLKEHPLKSRNWGPFFEDIIEYSNTEINADTMAWYLLEHPAWSDKTSDLARGILDGSAATFGTNGWSAYGVTAIQEQTAYRVPGNSHSARHASVELLYAAVTGDASRKDAAIRLLNWATYMVDQDGKNRYPNDDIWLTDGYGDYIRHYLRAMAAAPELAPADEDHLLRTTSPLRQISYEPGTITYRTFAPVSEDLLRISFTPASLTADGKPLARLESPPTNPRTEGYVFEGAGDPKGTLRIFRQNGRAVRVSQDASPPPSPQSTPKAARRQK